MRKIVTFFAFPAVTGAALVAAVGLWRRNPRIGTAFVNSVVNPALLRRGLAGYGRSEIGTLEHVGRMSGVRRLTPVHPEPTPAGFRIIVPLGMRSEWARNVIAAGHCRLLLHDQVFDLDEPAMVDAGAGAGSALAAAARSGGARVPVPQPANVRVAPRLPRDGRRGCVGRRRIRCRGGIRRRERRGDGSSLIVLAGPRSTRIPRRTGVPASKSVWPSRGGRTRPAQMVERQLRSSMPGHAGCVKDRAEARVQDGMP